MRNICLELLGLAPLVRVGDVHIDRCLDEGDKGDQDGEAEDGEALGVVLGDVVEVNVLILLLADEQNVTLECKLWPRLEEAYIEVNENNITTIL